MSVRLLYFYRSLSVEFLVVLLPTLCLTYRALKHVYDICGLSHPNHLRPRFPHLESLWDDGITVREACSEVYSLASWISGRSYTYEGKEKVVKKKFVLSTVIAKNDRHLMFVFIFSAVHSLALPLILLLLSCCGLLFAFLLITYFSTVLRLHNL
jgi:hypothetical protein